jgi:hypothetical protein
MKENKVAFKLWLLCKRQWRVGAGGAVGLDWPAIMAIAKLYRIRITPELFQKFTAIETYELSTRAVEK